MPVVLDGGRGEPASICWVVAHDSQILVAVNNGQISGGRLATAAPIYGLTRAQMRLAALIIDGHSLVDAARLLGVSINTTRTHLKRMFEKTGVRTQPALVRALLRVASPLN